MALFLLKHKNIKDSQEESRQSQHLMPGAHLFGDESLKFLYKVKAEKKYK